jgi:hypothetical protein
MDKLEVITRLRELAKQSPSSREGLKLLVDDSVTLGLAIRDQYRGHDVPETVWHFLSDADIRFKESQYRVIQLRELEEILRTWESGRAGQ